MSTEEKVSTATGGGESITKGALALPLAERTALRDELIKSADEQKKRLREVADEAAKL